MTSNRALSPSGRRPDIRWFGLLAALLLVIAAGQAVAQGRPVGQIDTVQGDELPNDAVVVRATGGTVRARSLVRLYDGDRVVVTGADTRLTVFVGGAEAAVPVTRANSPFVVRGRASGPMSAFVAQMLSGLDLLFNRPQLAIATTTEARGSEDDPVASAFLPSGPQRLPAGARRLVILWSGPASPVRVEQAGQTREWVASIYTSTVIEAPAEGDFDIVLPGAELGWSVTRVAEDGTPRTPSVRTAGPPTPDDRLAEALWLLAEGEPEWRLFALSEVADLAQTDYGAARLLVAIRSGEIEPADLSATSGS